jgi:hypothetical protein
VSAGVWIGIIAGIVVVILAFVLVRRSRTREEEA